MATKITLQAFCLLLLFSLQAPCEAKESTETLRSQLEVVQTVKSTKNCFSGAFENYSTWISQIQTKNKGNERFSLDSFKSTYPEADFNDFEKSVSCFNFIYEVDGLNIGGFILAPSDQPLRSNLPVIVFNRGGTATFGNMTFAALFKLVFPVAQSGFVVIGSQYRGGLGDSISNGGTDEWGGQDLNDVLALQEIIGRLDIADESRIGMYGGSRGGMMTLMAVKNGFPAKAIALGAPSLDLQSDLKWRPAMEDIYLRYMPGFENDREKVLFERSATNWIEKLDPNAPILIGQGAYDERVNPASTLKFALKLQESSRVYKLVIYERDDHFFSRNFEDWEATYIAWFKKYLMSDS